MGRNIQVMVVDDDRRMVKTICDILKIQGYEVVEAYSGEEAIEKMRSDISDCVLMDIRMEGIDGIETLKRLKEVYPALPVILMSGYANDEQAEQAKSLGAYTVLTSR